MATWAERAADLIPGGSSTGSKRPDALWGDQVGDATLPTHYERAEGCHLWTPDGRRWLDCTMALGAVGIGYADPDITAAVQRAAAQGPVAALPHRLEVEVAARLVECIPCAEQVRFLRTGAEATAAAVRLARTATGRTHLIACGYFGWLDWCSAAAGVLPAEREAITWIPFGEVAALEAAVTAHAHDLAAIVVEPFVHDVAPLAWLQAARTACDRTGAVLVFDEVKTAFRVRTGGVQELLRVIPDLTTVGKALANGYPLAAVVGRAAIMGAATTTWISSTAAAEATGLAAAQAVLELHERLDVPLRMAEAGATMQAIVAEALTALPVPGVQVAGPPVMWRLSSDHPDELDAVVAGAARAGVLLKRGAYQFPSLAHDAASLEALRVALQSWPQWVRVPERASEAP